MKILKASFENYKGFYAGQDRTKIFTITFPENNSPINLIKAGNHRGKSTLVNSLSILPDANDNFMDEIKARKIITLRHNDIIYQIECIHDIKPDKSRATTKVYCKKITLNGITELNPNGNVSDYKDFVESEFGLNTSTIALTHLTSEDRGMADKKPTERKKFVSSLLTRLVSYNEMNKIFTKKQSMYKSQMVSVLSKIDNIGDVSKLKTQIGSITNQIRDLTSNRDNLLEQCTYNKSLISIKDPGNVIQNKYTEIYNEIKQLNSLLEINNAKITSLSSKINIITDGSNTTAIINDTNNQINNIKSKIAVAESELINITNNRDKNGEALAEKTAKLLSLQIPTGDDNDLKNFKQSRDECLFYLESTKNITDLDISICEAMNNAIDSIDSIISELRSTYSLGEIEGFENIDYKKPITELDTEIEELEKIIKQLDSEYNRYNALYELANELSMRPEECTNNRCPFIIKALEASMEEPERRMNEINLEFNEYNQQLSMLINFKNKLMNYNIFKVNLENVYRIIEGYSSILSKDEAVKNLLNREFVIKHILGGSILTTEFNTRISAISEKFYIKERLSILNNKIIDLENNSNLYKANTALYNELTNDITRLEIQMSEGFNKFNTFSENIESYKSQLYILESNKAIIEDINKLTIDNNLYTQKKDELYRKYTSISESMQEIKIARGEIIRLESEISRVTNILNPMIEDKSSLNHKLQLSIEYNNDLEELNAKFQKVSILREKSSSKEGIQLIFMDLHFGQTVKIANDLLSIMFEGEYCILPFKIDDSEFRIPILHDGWTNDDITSCSKSELSMITIMISFAMLYQTGAAYNILKLDEIDAGLDTANRARFIVLIEQVIKILGIEQVIIVSHNNEYILSNTNVIALSDDVIPDLKDCNIVIPERIY